MIWPRLGRAGLGAVVLGLVLASAAAASSARGPLDDFTATLSVSQSSSGSAAAPAPLGFAEQVRVQPAASVNAAPLTALALTLPQVRADPGDFPTCSARAIDAVHSVAGCPSGALVATGVLSGALWSPAQPGLTGLPCYSDLDVFNGGHHSLTAFVAFPTGFWCDDLQTGAVPAWSGTLSQSGTTLRIDLPLPPAISTDTGNTGLFMALNRFTLDFPQLTARAGRITVGYLSSTSCAAHRWPAGLGLVASDGSAQQESGLIQLARC